MKEARQVLALFRKAQAEAIPHQLPLATEGSKGQPPRRAGEAWLHAHLGERFDVQPEYPLPEQVEGSALFLALQHSPRYMPEGMREAAEELFSDRALVLMLASTLTLYALAWVVPEPLFSKAFAVSMTVVLTLAFTVAELTHMGMVCLRLYQQTQGKRTREEIEAAAEHFGRYLGGAALRALLFIAGRSLGKSLPQVPEGGLRALLARHRFAGANGLVLQEAPSTQAVVMANTSAVGMPGTTLVVVRNSARSACADGSLKLAQYTWHHLATNKNEKSPVQGGPWTPRFEKIFATAGMTLETQENKVYLEHHAGPHPEEYHEEVFRRLRLATNRCPAQQECRQRLVEELRRIAREVCTAGSRLNQLATRP